MSYKSFEQKTVFRLGSDSCTHSAQQVHNSKTRWSGAQCVDSTSLCLAVVHLLYTVSISIIFHFDLVKKKRLFKSEEKTIWNDFFFFIVNKSYL
jgi:hypothetical protein